MNNSIRDMVVDMIKRKAIRRKFRIAVTGHRKMSTNEKKHKEYMNKLRIGTDVLIHILVKHLNVDRSSIRFLHGVASGVDITFGDQGLRLGIPVHLYFPFPYEVQKEKAKWRRRERLWVAEQIVECEKIVEVCDKFYTYGYQKRNMALVDNCDLLALCFTRDKSGSGNCYRYARKQNVLTVDLLELAEIDVSSLYENRIFDLFKL